MALVKCKKGGKEIADDLEFCSECEPKKKKFSFKDKKVLMVILVVVVVIGIGTFVGITIHNNQIKAQEEAERKEQERYDALPIKVNISMTSYYGSIEYILYELDLDFDLVTMGANCYTGVQKNEFKTEKYGILYTEFRYCKNNYSTIFRVYNDSKDQELRDPKPGELPSFDKYGEKEEKENNSL